MKLILSKNMMGDYYESKRNSEEISEKIFY